MDFNGVCFQIFKERYCNRECHNLKTQPTLFEKLAIGNNNRYSHGIYR